MDKSLQGGFNRYVLVVITVHSLISSRSTTRIFLALYPLSDIESDVCRSGLPPFFVPVLMRVFVVRVGVLTDSVLGPQV